MLPRPKLEIGRLHLSRLYLDLTFALRLRVLLYIYSTALQYVCDAFIGLIEVSYASTGAFCESAASTPSVQAERLHWTREYSSCPQRSRWRMKNEGVRTLAYVSIFIFDVHRLLSLAFLRISRLVQPSVHISVLFYNAKTNTQLSLIY